MQPCGSYNEQLHNSKFLLVRLNMANYNYSKINEFSLGLKKGTLKLNFEANKNKLTLNRDTSRPNKD